MASLTIHNARVVTPAGILDPGFVTIADGRINTIGSGPPPAAVTPLPLGEGQGVRVSSAKGQGVRDASGLWLLPGFIDIHCHGGGGRSFQEPDSKAIDTVLATHARGGTTAIVPAIAACPPDERHACLQALSAASHSAVAVTPLPLGEGQGVRVSLGEGQGVRKASAEPSAVRVSQPRPEILGAYIEGPYFSQKERGAQPANLIGPPSPHDYAQTLEAFGESIKVWSLAPELPGTVEFIRELRRRGIVAALGHSDASEGHVAAAVEAGASLVTHVYCAQSTFHRVEADKKLGLAEMALLMDELSVEVIADGKHLPPRLLRLICRNKSPDQTCLITDAMPAAGMEPGEYQFLGDTVWVTEEVAYRADRRRYAGSVLTMARALSTTHRLLGASMEDLAVMASLTPARIAGVSDRKGTIEPGKNADLVLMDDDFTIHRTVCGGRAAYSLHPP